MSKTPNDSKSTKALLTELAEMELDLARKLAERGRKAESVDEMVRLAESFERMALSIMTNLAMASELSTGGEGSPDAAPGAGDGEVGIAGISLTDLQRKPDEPLQ